jgi:hypothetical protein
MSVSSAAGSYKDGIALMSSDEFHVKVKPAEKAVA